jgi:PKD repeat protein
MNHIIQKILVSFLAFSLIIGPIAHTFSAEEDPVYTTLRSIDLWTFNEYRYRITEQFFALRENQQIEGLLDKNIIQNIAVLANDGYKYLPDNLVNKNYLSELMIDLQRGVKYPSNESAYTEIVKGIAEYLENVEISSISGDVEASPVSGNAPLTSTLRAKVQDPSGTQIKTGNYTWWVDNAGDKVVIWRGPSINYSFRNEGKFSVFLDVTSAHKNSEGFTDVLPFSQRVDITVNEKIASLIVKVNSDRVDNETELKFTPENASYGLLFDATSSTPTSGTKFSRTQWDFGNGITRSYSGWPKIERIRYGREGDYDVTLKLITNEGKQVEKNFIVSVHDPIATIEVNREDGFIGDQFTFSAKSSGIYRDLTYAWEIINIDTDRVVHQKSDKVLTYAFTDKWKYNVKLKVRRSSGEIDQDTRIVYVTSQAPIAEFESSRPFSHKPNKVFLDGSRSFDPDLTDDGNLKYEWYIDGSRVNLEDSHAKGSVGYYTFDSVGTHSVNLEVTDLDGITTVKKWTVEIDSVLSVEMFAFPRVIQREWFIKFVSESPEAEVYEWDFGDGKKTGGSVDKVTHTYEKSGTFDVKLTVSDRDNNSNTYTRTVYVSESDKPLAFIDIFLGGLEKPEYNSAACSGEGWYIIDRVSTIQFDGGESINIDGQSSWLEHSWKIGNGKFSTAPSVSHRFDEIGCFSVKLTVKSDKNSATSNRTVNLDVRNVVPTMSALKVVVEDPTTDPLVVRVGAQWANDPDGVIQSYLWYYYTDTDTQPQDFRSTASSSTAFVIPKITGNYYFVAILKDNNEARVTSEEVTGARYFTTITGDNINTPIVELSVNDNSAVIGEEIIFTAKAKNILGQQIEKDASFSWDFDGDGFYETQTNDSITTYKYNKSGEFYAKVKVKYKGISSTKNITMNVSNKLVADFDYISIGNKFIFFDSSNGQIDARSWDLGDGTKKTGTYFEHTYTDGKASHDISLQITEGTKTKEIQKTVTKNIKNILKTKGSNLVLFTSPLVEEGKIVFENSSERFFVYLWESDEATTVYGIDYDIENDSDLNGWADDDEDNKGTASYVSGDVAEIPLSNFNIQKIRVFIKDADGNILWTEDIEIEKTYIEEKDIDPDTIIFEGVSESEREKIELLKSSLLKLPQQQKLRALSFVQKLQENWNDNTEKTRTILDFENYIFGLGLDIAAEDELINTLESLLVEWQEDQSAKQITYQALVNLVPQGIECEVEMGICYDSLLAKLEDIRSSDDTDYNKALGKEILQVIGITDLMTNSQKLDLKAILTTLVYGGEVSSIPEDEKQEIIGEAPDVSQDDTNGWVLGILLSILKWIAYFIILFLLLIAGFYIIYRVVNKDKNISFSQFVSNTTSFWKEDKQEPGALLSEEDILGDVLWEDTPESDILSSPKKMETSEPTTKNLKIASSQPSPLEDKWRKEWGDYSEVGAKQNAQVAEEQVPDWLKGNFSEDTTKSETPVKPVSKSIPPKEDTKPVEIKKGEVPDVKAKIVEAPTEDSFDLEKDTKIPSDEKVPDWLKGSFDTPKKDEAKPEETKPQEITVKSTQDKTIPQEKKTEVVPEKKEEVVTTREVKQKTSEKKEESLISDEKVPDWHKGSFDTPKKDEAKPEETKPEETKTTKTDTPKKTAKPEIKKAPAPSDKTGQKTKAQSTDKKPEKKEELWDDGMKIPDWLKADEEK